MPQMLLTSSNSPWAVETHGNCSLFPEKRRWEGEEGSVLAVQTPNPPVRAKRAFLRVLLGRCAGQRAPSWGMRMEGESSSTWRGSALDQRDAETSNLGGLQSRLRRRPRQRVGQEPSGRPSLPVPMQSGVCCQLLSCWRTTSPLCIPPMSPTAFNPRGPPHVPLGRESCPPAPGFLRAEACPQCPPPSVTLDSCG